jgi:hypothetical protein
MKYIFVIFLISPAFASEKFITTSYYEAGGDKFRVEKVVSFEECKEKVAARKIILDKKNELREIALWDASGKMEEAGANNNPLLRAKVEEAFGSATTGESPCQTTAPSTGSKASAQ